MAELYSKKPNTNDPREVNYILANLVKSIFSLSSCNSLEVTRRKILRGFPTEKQALFLACFVPR